MLINIPTPHLYMINNRIIDSNHQFRDLVIIYKNNLKCETDINVIVHKA